MNKQQIIKKTYLTPKCKICPIDIAYPLLNTSFDGGHNQAGSGGALGETENNHVMAMSYTREDWGIYLGNLWD